MITRRGLVGGFVSLVAAPAIVRASSIMPIYVPKLEVASQPIGLAQIRDILMPGLREMCKEYETPPGWGWVYSEEANV